MTQVDPEAIRNLVEAATNGQPAAVPIRATGWGWTAYGVWALVILMTPIVVALTRMWPAMKKLRNEADGSLRTDLMGRLAKVEADLAAERRECNCQLHAMQNKMDAVMRQFVQFQITVARYMPAEHASKAQNVANRLLEIIATDVEEFAPEPEECEAHRADGDG